MFTVNWKGSEVIKTLSTKTISKAALKEAKELIDFTSTSLENGTLFLIKDDVAVGKIFTLRGQNAQLTKYKI